MIDPVPVGYIELNDAMLRRAADISDLEYQERVPQFRKYWEQVHGVTFKVDEPKQTRQPRNEVEIENQERENRNRDAARLWRKREFAIYDLYAALCQGSLIALVREPASGQMFKPIFDSAIY